ncbi:hypothetical protein BDV18DRAFT_156731 [Aspergillus unguis]
MPGETRKDIDSAPVDQMLSLQLDNAHTQSEPSENDLQGPADENPASQSQFVNAEAASHVSNASRMNRNLADATQAGEQVDEQAIFGNDQEIRATRENGGQIRISTAGILTVAGEEYGPQVYSGRNTSSSTRNRVSSPEIQLHECVACT